jgi:hypothetical protein
MEVPYLRRAGLIRGFASSVSGLGCRARGAFAQFADRLPRKPFWRRFK